MRQCAVIVLLSLPLFFTHPAPPEIYTLSLHDALPICVRGDMTTNLCAAGSKTHQRHVLNHEPRGVFLDLTHDRAAFLGVVGAHGMGAVTHCGMSPGSSRTIPCSANRRTTNSTNSLNCVFVSRLERFFGF